MNGRVAVLVALACAAAFATACSAPASVVARRSEPFTQPWDSGLSAEEPAFQVQSLDKNTFAIRQSITSTFEAPFLYLIFGRDQALLIDTGVEGPSLRAVIDRLVDNWLVANRQAAISLVVMHSHGHRDHVGGDAGFKNRAHTVVVGHSSAEVARFFGISAWPADTAAFDLGGRVVDIVPTPGHHPSHVMVFDRATRILFSGDTIYPGRLYFQCARAEEYRASIERVAAFAATRQVRWLLGAHIEMKSAPGQAFEAEDRARHDEHLLEMRPSILEEVRQALLEMGKQVRVESHDDFILFPHPADPRGKSPPDWCLPEEDERLSPAASNPSLSANSCLAVGAMRRLRFDPPVCTSKLRASEDPISRISHFGRRYLSTGTDANPSAVELLRC